MSNEFRSSGVQNTESRRQKTEDRSQTTGLGNSDARTPNSEPFTVRRWEAQFAVRVPDLLNSVF